MTFENQAQSFLAYQKSGDTESLRGVIAETINFAVQDKQCLPEALEYLHFWGTEFELLPLIAAVLDEQEETLNTQIRKMQNRTKDLKEEAIAAQKRIQKLVLLVDIQSLAEAQRQHPQEQVELKSMDLAQTQDALQSLHMAVSQRLADLKALL